MRNIIDFILDLFTKKTVYVAPVNDSPVIKAITPGMVSYLLNDPTTPDLMIQMAIPPKPSGPEFRVYGFDQSNMELGTSGGRAGNCYITIAESLNFVQKQVRQPIKKWSTVDILNVNPEAGQQFNAFYDRSGLLFFYAPDPITKKTVYCSEGTDIVSHELGHAILDSIRPDLWNLQALEIWGFHEAFGDCLAILHLMGHEEVLQYALKQTDGDLRHSNVISRIACELGAALYHVTGGADGSVAGYLRDAVNSFTYTQPEKLPVRTRINELAAEPHSFSRIWLGAWYDFMINVYEQDRNAGMSPIEALGKARDIAGSYLLEAVKYAPAVPRFYSAVARAMLMIDRSSGMGYQHALNQSFIKRQIIMPDVPLMMPKEPGEKWSDLVMSLKIGDEVLTRGFITAVRAAKTKIMRTGVVGMATNPLSFVLTECPSDDYYEFDHRGNLLRKISTSAEEVDESAKACLNIMQNLGLVGPDGHSSFEVRDGKLVRLHFACGGGSINNSIIPGAPEFGKRWKPENNCGCGFPCGKPKERPGTQTIARGCFSTINVCRTTTIRNCSSTRIT